MLFLAVLIESTPVHLVRRYLVIVFANNSDAVLEAGRLVSIVVWSFPLTMLSFLGMSVGGVQDITYF